MSIENNQVVAYAVGNAADNDISRRGGSYVEGLEGADNIRAFLTSLDWEDATELVEHREARLGNCLYFYARIDRPAFVGVKAFSLLTEEELSQVRVVSALHSNLDGSEAAELVLDTIQAQPVTFVVIAIGNPKGPYLGDWDETTSLVYTWHPGWPTKSRFPVPGVEETKRELAAGLIHPYAAVKLAPR
jgi:hypothetical protein